LANLREKLQEAVPGVRIVGAHAPPFGTLDELIHGDSVAQVGAVAPHITWVALGAPKQEIWMSRATDSLPGVLLVGVGAAFDFHSGASKRAPVWMQERGLEWLHRLCSNPRRLAGRYARANSRFLYRVMREGYDGQRHSASPQERIRA
jgi:N-acetylglucosaminyldiphosphoundecaprenol N-acetyl-beta-D-mannosaminyltransferase